MGKAAVELAEPPPSAGDAGNADELLSQMAGDEIDRLLAEADVEPTAAAATPDMVATPAVDASAGVVAASNSAPSSRSDDMIDSADLAPQLDALFEQLNAQNDASESDAAVVTAIAPPTVETDNATAHPEAPATDSAASTAVLETRTSDEPDDPVAAALAAPDDTALSEHEVTAHPASQRKHATGVAGLVEQLLNVLLLPLQMLNEPLENCSDSLRQGLGWIGIVTTINAVAVIAYVLLFRRH
jgi:hypothetical protein